MTCSVGTRDENCSLSPQEQCTELFMFIWHCIGQLSSFLVPGWTVEAAAILLMLDLSGEQEIAFEPASQRAENQILRS